MWCGNFGMRWTTKSTLDSCHYHAIHPRKDKSADGSPN